MRLVMWRMHIACWIYKDEDKNSEYLILTASALQQLLHERTSKLRVSTLPAL